jgi:hypothetical protein
MSKTTKIDNLITRPTQPVISCRRNLRVPRQIRFVVFLVLSSPLLILNTSFNNGRNEMKRIESEYMIPALISGLKSTLDVTGTNGPDLFPGGTMRLVSEVKQYYVLHCFRPAWTFGNRLNENGTKLIYLFEHAREFGLEPDHYHLTAVKEIQQQMSGETNPASLLQLRKKTEILMTDGALMFMVNLHCGYGPFDTTLFSKVWMDSLPKVLLDGTVHDRLLINLVSIQPRFVEYRELLQATVNFVRHTELTDDWQKISVPGDSILFKEQLKQILIRLGYMYKYENDTDIPAAIRQFQNHNGIEPDGMTGKNTLEALRMTSLYRYRMLALNLDRLRKQDNSETNLLYVNIPSYHLKVFRENQLQETYRIIVGNPKTPTPLLSSWVERIITNPVWDVPRSITLNELLPKIKADSGYLKRNCFRLLNRQNRTVDYENIDPDMITDAESGLTIRQDASSDNSLGRIKFIFPNPYAVYLHDTPGKALFTKDIRALSHGCIRIQNPEKLAEYLVKVIQSDTMDLNSLIAGGVQREINLTTRVPIHIRYITCDTDEKGDPFFYKDIYGIDQKELAELAPFMGI